MPIKVLLRPTRAPKASNPDRNRACECQNGTSDAERRCTCTPSVVLLVR